MTKVATMYHCIINITKLHCHQIPSRSSLIYLPNPDTLFYPPPISALIYIISYLDNSSSLIIDLHRSPWHFQYIHHSAATTTFWKCKSDPLTSSRFPLTVWINTKVANMALKGLHYLTSLYSITSHGFNYLLLYNKAPKTLLAEITWSFICS